MPEHAMRSDLSIPFLATIALVGSLGLCADASTAAGVAMAPSTQAASRRIAKELDFSATELRLFKDPESGLHYWFFTYEVENNTGRDIRFAPRIELLIDDGRIVRQGDGVPGSVTAQIKEYLGNPLLEDQFEILGEVMQGKAHAKSGLVVFKAEDLTPTELTVFVQGLSRESERRPHPKTGELVTLRKTVRLDYLVPGDPKPIGTETYPIVTREWIFR
jgi:hypothetical protein